jgi:GNAT superfamily N-acetyltransferase
MISRARPRPPLSAEPLTLRRLALADDARLAALAAMSGLHTLDEDARRRFLLRRGLVLAALLPGGDVIGCCCVEPHAARCYVHISGRIVSLPPSNAYLCGTFVHPAYRGRGIGGLLYSKRLELVEASGVECAAVEILGDGMPYSVSPSARPGLSFHRRVGFAVHGYSLEKDHGPMLIRSAAADRISGP